MGTPSETGLNKNLDNFDGITTDVKGLKKYDPANPALLISALMAKASYARNTFSVLSNVLPALSEAMRVRSEAFEPLNDTVSRVVSSLKSYPISKLELENVMTLVRKIKGTRAKPKLTKEEKTVREEEGKSTKEISTSQLSYSSRLENLEKLISLLTSFAFYTPNEEELSVPGLKKYYNDLLAKNQAVEVAAVPVFNARIERDKALYAKNDGNVDTGNAVKAYVRSVYGNKSTEFQRITKFIFKGKWRK
jgi:hypothetical protein